MQLDDNLREAMAWRQRIRAGNDADWEAFVVWLEGDPARSDAYDRVAMADQSPGPADDAVTGGFLPVMEREERGAPALARRRPMLGIGAAAAALAAVCGGIVVLRSAEPARDLYQIASAPGQRRVIALDGGTRITLNGGTKVRLDRRDTRFAELATGEANFVVRHDPAAPFDLRIGDDVIRDTGTRFNVLREDGRLEVEVAEGSVLYNPAGEAISLRAGQALRLGPQGSASIMRKAIADMNSWQDGHLSYGSAPLAYVASDLSRSLGVPITLADGLEQTSFAGSIRIDGDAAASIERLAASLGLEARRTGPGWMIAPRSRASR